MLKIFEKLFIKKRFILKWSNSNIYNIPDHKGYDIKVLKTINEFDDYIAKDHLFLKRNRLFLKKLERFEWRLFTIKNEEKKELAGYYFAILGTNKPVKHDNFIIMQNEALLCNAFIYSKYRKKGLYKTLIKFSHTYLLKEYFRNIYTIVEKSNTASLKANLASGLAFDKTNYLVKFFGINVLSLFYKQNKLYLILSGRIFCNKKIYQA